MFQLNDGAGIKNVNPHTRTVATISALVVSTYTCMKVYTQILQCM